MAEVEDIEKGHHHHHHNHHKISSTTTQASMNNNFPRDLLKRFMAVNNNHHHKLPLPVVKAEQGDEEEGIELSLGLSMNGRFGVDPTAKKIKRTTSIPEFVRDEEITGGVSVGCTPLVRTCSLPTETEEEWRKRKELQTLRRMEARRKRSEKQRNLKAMKERVGTEGNNNNNNNNNNNPVEQGVGGFNEVVTTLGRTLSLSSHVSGLGLNGDKEEKKGSSGVVLPPPSSSRGSVGSSGTSEPECQQGQGTTPMDAGSPAGGANVLADSELKPPVTSGARVAENSGKNAAVTMRNQHNEHTPAAENRTKDIVRDLLEDMPCVSTKGEGPNGKRIEGFLYRYGKGEEVRIVCVCHGSFLTPSEFIKHAGGGDVANPLKHIVVSPSFL